eukprot:1177254-Rhodomonas_salina.2
MRERDVTRAPMGLLRSEDGGRTAARRYPLRLPRRERCVRGSRAQRAHVIHRRPDPRRGRTYPEPGSALRVGRVVLSSVLVLPAVRVCWYWARCTVVGYGPTVLRNVADFLVESVREDMWEVCVLATGIYGGNADTYGGNADIYGGNADTYGGKADMYGGKADMYGGNADTYGGYADIYCGNADTSGTECRHLWRQC